MSETKLTIENRKNLETDALISLLLSQLEYRGSIAYLGTAYHALTSALKNEEPSLGGPTFTDNELDQLKDLQLQINNIMKKAGDRFQDSFQNRIIAVSSVTDIKLPTHNKFPQENIIMTTGGRIYSLKNVDRCNHITHVTYQTPDRKRYQYIEDVYWHDQKWIDVLVLKEIFKP